MVHPYAPNRLWLVVLIPLWYASSALCVANSKVVLRNVHPLHCPLSMTAMQFVFSTLLGSLCAITLGRRPPPRVVLRELILVSGAYTLGFVLLNSSLGKLAAAFSETVRSLEPITSFALTWACGGRGASLNMVSGAALLAVILGGGVSVASQPKFDIVGLIFGFGANFMFSSRTLLVTLMQDKLSMRMRLDDGGGSVPVEIDPIGLFTAQHAVGLLLMVPITLWLEGTECAVTAIPALPQPAFLSSLGFFFYNFLSLVCLLMLNAVTHSVANSLRRAVTIVSAAILFHTSVSAESALGVALIIGGSIAYALAKATPQKRAPPDETETDPGSEDGLVAQQAHDAASRQLPGVIESPQSKAEKV